MSFFNSRSLPLESSGLRALEEQPFSRYAGARPHRCLAAEDPLDFYRFRRHVPRLNRRADVRGLVELLREVLGAMSSDGEPIAVDRSWTYAQAAAAMRDVGLVLGSIRRHGEEPLDHVPELEPFLLWLGRRTDLPPRDTLLHYTLWNPEDRLRTYTSLPEEVELIRAVRIAFPALEEAISHLVELFEIPLSSPDFAHVGERIHHCMDAVRNAAVHTFRHVDRGVFIREIRPYFEPIRVGGVDYLGPGAVAMPLFVFDHILWSAPVTEPSYVKFKEDYLPVTLPYLRALYRRFSDEGCLLERLAGLGADDPALDSPHARAGLLALEKSIALCQRFRSVHLRMAEQAYVKQQSEFEHGSGGYRPDMLEHIFRLAGAAQERLRSLIPDEGPGALSKPEVRP